MMKLKHQLSLRLNIVNLCVTLRLVVCINNAVPSEGRRSVSTVLSYLASCLLTGAACAYTVRTPGYCHR